jgi:predicted TIM-barrel fold metal-dependent hydrolase
VIIDCHAHLASPRHLPPRFFEGWANTIKRGLPRRLEPREEARLDQLFASLNHDPECSQMLKEMDAAGIDKAVLLVVDFGEAFGKPEIDLESLHLEVARLARVTGRFIGFAGVDPRRGKDGLLLFERALRDWGMRGLKLYPPCGFSPSDPRLFPFYEICAAYRVPVLSHVGPTTSSLSFSHTHPQDLDAAAFQFPKVNFILAHAAVVWNREAALLAEYRPNVYLDVAGFQRELEGGRFAEMMREHMRRNLGRKLLFGTDWPIHRLLGSQKQWVDSLRNLVTERVLSEQQLGCIFGENAAELIPGLHDPVQVSEPAA